MGRHYSDDLRERVLKEAEQSSARRAAARFGISAATAVRWVAPVRPPSPSIRTLVLPDAEIARNYPTRGPEGLHTMDVNGSACPVEMFLGREALTGTDGRLRPARWTAWNKNARRYPGEVEDKSAASESFLKAIGEGDSPRELRVRFPDMDRLLSSIFDAFDDP